MAALQAAIMENERTVLPPTFTQNVSQMEGGVPVIKGMTDVPVGKEVANPGYKSKEDRDYEALLKKVRAEKSAGKKSSYKPITARFN